MKKLIALALALVLAVSLVACGPKTPAVESNKPSTESQAPDVVEPSFSKDLTAFYNDLMNAAEMAPMMMVMSADKEMLEATYPGLTAIETKQLIAAAPAMSAVAVEFVFVEVANAADVEAVKTILQTRIDNQVAGGAWYPETIEQWEKHSEIVVIDNFVCLFVNSDKDGMIDSFRNGTEMPVWAKAPEVTVDLAGFYNDIYNELYPLDEEGNFTGPYAEDIALMPEMLDSFYPGLSAIETKQLLAYMPMMSAVAYEVVLVEVANEADVAAVEAILQARIDSVINDQMNYPAVIEGWQNNSRIVSYGNFILMAVGTDCDYFTEAFGWNF